MEGSLVYDWDSNCQRIYDYIHRRLTQARRELNELLHSSPEDPLNLLYYYKKWHYNNELFTRINEEIAIRKKILETLHKKGYGVSTALAEALTGMQKREMAECLGGLINTFGSNIDKAKAHMYISPDQIANRNSSYIIRELCRKLGENYEANLPVVTAPLPGIPVDLFLRIQRETPPHAHISIMNRMFLEISEESGTIMEGTIGEINVDPPQHLKFIASRNLRELFSCLYESIGENISIDLEWIRKIHYFLTKDLDTSHTWKAGEFRKEDFKDRSGLTFNFGNFGRGLQEIDAFLSKANWNTRNIQTFISYLSKLYYMLLGIHPFTDSNGRTAKCIVNHLLMRRGLPPLIFDVFEEILYLPRYGGSVLMMERYFTARIAISIERYVFEREKIEHFGNLEKHFFRSDFDAGFYFRHLNGMFPLIEVDFKVYIIPPGNPLMHHYMNQCRIALPGESSLRDLKLYYGFTKDAGAEWECRGELSPDLFWKRGHDSHGIPFFNITCFIQTGPHLTHCDNLEISLTCPSQELIFNNKGLNYRFEMDKEYLLKLLGNKIVGMLTGGDALQDGELSQIRKLREHIEHSAYEIAKTRGIDLSKDCRDLRAGILSENQDVAGIFRFIFIPQLLQYIVINNLTGKQDPAHSHNANLLHYCVNRLTPAAEKLFGFP